MARDFKDSFYYAQRGAKRRLADIHFVRPARHHKAQALAGGATAEQRSMPLGFAQVTFIPLQPSSKAKAGKGRIDFPLR